MKTLIVEDDYAARNAMSALLRSIGIDVVEADCVAEGIAGLGEQPDLVILDLVLPDGDGLDVLREIRKQLMQTKVAVVTGVTHPAALEEVKQWRPDVLLAKPLEFEMFRDWIARELTEDAMTVAAAD